MPSGKSYYTMSAVEATRGIILWNRWVPMDPCRNLY